MLKISALLDYLKLTKNKMIKKLALILLSLIFLTACSMNSERIATIETNLGTIKIKLYEKEAPNTTKNFIELAKKGYYDGIIFHRVIEDFMIQTGDPTGTGRGGETYNGEVLKDEFAPGLTHIQGVVSMANAGPNTNGSQFFIVTNPDGTKYLDGRHSIFGQVVEGMDVAIKISQVERDGNDKPLEPVVMNKVTISE